MEVFRAVLIVMVPLGTVLLWLIRIIVRDENAKQLVNINGTYMRTIVANVLFDEVHARIDMATGQQHRRRRGDTPPKGM